MNSGSWWWTGRPGMLRFMGSQRVGHDWATDLIWSLIVDLQCCISFRCIAKWFRYICELRAQSLQSCLTLCDPMDCSSPSSSVHGILQARILEWIAMPSSSGSSWPRDWTQVMSLALAGGFFTHLGSHLGSPGVCMYIYFRFFSLIGWVRLPVLYSRSFLVVYFYIY